jgi:hypothetical protein
MRRLRSVKLGGELKLLIVWTRCDCPFLRPDRDGQVNSLVLGVLAKAQSKENVEVFAVAVLPHEVRILARFDDTRQMKSFMHFFDGNLSKIVGPLPDVRQQGGTLWRDRYRDIDVHDAPEDQVACFKEVLAAPCAEGYVDRLSDWPGVHCADVLCQGAKKLKGTWHHPAEGTVEEVEVRLTPLRCWADLAPTQRRGKTRKLVREIEAETARRRGTGHPACGAEAVLALDPRDGPVDVPRWETPYFFSLDEEARGKMREIYLEVVKDYRDAANRLRRMKPSVAFPEGTFPPPLPYAVPWPGQPPN